MESRSKYLEKYIKAIYESKREDLIKKLEDNFIPQIELLPYESLTLDAAIKGIEKDLKSIRFVRKELQENQEFIEKFSNSLISFTNSETMQRTLNLLKILGVHAIHTETEMLKNFFIENSKYILSDEIKLLLIFYCN
jgi:hypothetical protein